MKKKAVLFTADGHKVLQRGKIQNVLATVNFGTLDAGTIDIIWSMLKDVEPEGPLVNSEFYPGNECLHRIWQFLFNQYK